MDMMYDDKKQHVGIERTTEKIHSSQLLAALDKYSSKIKVLSLDCFDTILFRKTATPADVFYAISSRPILKEAGFSHSLRGAAEARARHLKYFIHGTPEVNLNEIYANSFNKHSQEDIDKFSEEELATEMEMCYGFPPMLDLIREAHARGLKIIIVSDTYLKEEQLRRLLKATLPEDILPKIDKIFCSCEHGRNKANGLLELVLHPLAVPADTVLHIGDNPVADYVPARKLNMNALHFVHHEEILSDIFRLQAIAIKMLDSSVGVSSPIYSPFHGVFSATKISMNNPETLIGYASLGPIMYAFAKFICNEVETLKREGRNPKVAFIMRDAHLPSLACEALAGYEVGKRIRISRFASYAASFRDREDIVKYLMEIGKTNRFKDVCRQFLLPEKISDPIIKKAMLSQNPELEFAQLVLRTETVRIILHKSAEYRKRLRRYIDKQFGGIKKGDTLVLVDLGYSGTAQRRLAPIFTEDGIDVQGRYLIALRTPYWQETRKGLLDPSNSYDTAMQALVFYIMILETLSTSNERSVVDYDEEGNVIFSDIEMSKNQHAQLVRIQSECVRFVTEAKQFFAASNTTLSDEMLRQNATAELARMLYFQSNQELDYLVSFEAEMNLGTTDVLRVFDPEQGIKGLRRRGMFYLEKPSKVTRTNYPAELRKAGMEFTLSLLAQHRFNLDLKMKDMLLREEKLHIMFRRGHEVHETTVEAYWTNEGYFAAWLPAGTGDMEVRILAGKSFRWIQIDSVELIKMEAFVNQTEAGNTIDAWPFVTFDKMNDHGERLYECTSESSAIIMKPTINLGQYQCIFRFVYRPTVRRVADTVKNEGEKKASYSVSL